MERLEQKCQLRADLKSGALPDALLRNPEIRGDLAKTFSFSDRRSEEASEELLKLLSRPGSVRPEAIAGIVKQLQERIELFNGIYRSEAGSQETPRVIENLSIGTTSLYVRAEDSTEICEEILERVVGILAHHTGVADLGNKRSPFPKIAARLVSAPAAVEC